MGVSVGVSVAAGVIVGVGVRHAHTSTQVLKAVVTHSASQERSQQYESPPQTQVLHAELSHASPSCDVQQSPGVGVETGVGGVDTDVADGVIVGLATVQSQSLAHSTEASSAQLASHNVLQQNESS